LTESQYIPNTNRNARGILDTIVAAKRVEVAALLSRRAELLDRARQAAPTRGFAAALRGKQVRVIAEFKRRSPSAGWIREDADVGAIARVYETNGAAALSILTDQEFFGGSLSDLEEGRKVTRLPILRKDFVIDEIQLLQARAAGADAALLIVRILEETQLRDLLAFAQTLGCARDRCEQSGFVDVSNRPGAGAAHPAEYPRGCDRRCGEWCA
jgi:indole-3-glycerol phosphate synthase